MEGEVSKLKKLILLFFILVIISLATYSTTQLKLPDNNNLYITFTQGNGTVWSLIGSNIQPSDISYSLSVPSLANNNCIGTDANGLFQTGTCSGGGGGTTFNLLNLTNYFGDASFNSSVIRNSNLTLYNKSVSLDNYLTGSANGAFLKNLSPDVVFTTLNVSSINGTSIALFNKSISLDNYLNGLPANVWNLANLTNYFGDASINSSILRVTNISNIHNGDYNSVNFTTSFTTRSAELWNLLNLTNYFGDASFNSSVIRNSNLTLYNKSISLVNYNSSVSLNNYAINSSLGIYLTNLSPNVKLDSINITSNLTIQTNNSIWFNNSQSQNGDNKRIYSNETCIIIAAGANKFSICS